VKSLGQMAWAVPLCPSWPVLPIGSRIGAPHRAAAWAVPAQVRLQHPTPPGWPRYPWFSYPLPDPPRLGQDKVLGPWLGSFMDLLRCLLAVGLGLHQDPVNLEPSFLLHYDPAGRGAGQGQQAGRDENTFYLRHQSSNKVPLWAEEGTGKGGIAGDSAGWGRGSRPGSNGCPQKGTPEVSAMWTWMQKCWRRDFGGAGGSLGCHHWALDSSWSSFPP
jgi:hypothetical protein